MYGNVWAVITLTRSNSPIVVVSIENMKSKKIGKQQMEAGEGARYQRGAGLKAWWRQEGRVKLFTVAKIKT